MSLLARGLRRKLHSVAQIIRTVVIAALLVSLIWVSRGQPGPPTQSGGGILTNAPVKEIGMGIFQIGVVRLDKNTRSISLPASVCMTEGLIEYLLVHQAGKTHESLLRTEAEPIHIQIAMLLLGAKGAPPSALTNQPPGGQIVGNTSGKDLLPPIPGEPVTVHATWKSKGATNQCPIEDFVRNQNTKSTMTRGDFTFTGSRMWEGTFIAQREGSIITTITDPDAMFNNPRPGRENDEIWHIATNTVPLKDTALTLVISLKSNVNNVAPKGK